jgi:hypothetical protein
MHAKHPRYFRLALSMLQQAGSTQTPCLQGTKIPLHTTWVAHASQLPGTLLDFNYIMQASVGRAPGWLIQGAATILGASLTPWVACGDQSFLGFMSPLFRRNYSTCRADKEGSKDTE